MIFSPVHTSNYLSKAPTCLYPSFGCAGIHRVFLTQGPGQDSLKHALHGYHKSEENVDKYLEEYKSYFQNGNLQNLPGWARIQRIRIFPH